MVTHKTLLLVLGCWDLQPASHAPHRPTRVARRRQGRLGSGQGLSREDPHRDQVCLNGLWRWQPAKDVAVAYLPIRGAT